MTAADKVEFAKIINGLQAIKPGQKLTPEGIEIFWNAMRDWPIEAFKAAAEHLAATVEFMPNPFHFNQLRKATALPVGDAWEIALQRCSGWNGRKKATADDVIDFASKAIGGYRAIALANIETQLPYLLKRFTEAYEEAQCRDEIINKLPMLTQHVVNAEKQLELKTVIGSVIKPMIENKAVITVQK